MNDETQEFLAWRNGFSMEDDGLEAFRALKALDTIRFELTTRTEGYLGRIERAAQAGASTQRMVEG